jgi:hypothetical protein
MAADVNTIRYVQAKLPQKQYYWVMKTLQNSLASELSDIAKFRLHVLNHYYDHGLSSTLSAFNVGKTTLYDWKRLYEQSGKRMIALIPISTAPHHTRTMNTDWRLIEFIKQMRKEYGNIGKHIIKPFLDEYARSEGISSVGLTTIGKIIQRKGYTFETRVRIRTKNKYHKLRTRKSPRVTKPGFIQMDSIVVYINREKHLFMSVIDIYTKFAYVAYVKTLSSKTAAAVFKQFLKISPTPVHTVQTDNGSEFLAFFHRLLEEKHITHKFIYPRMCKVNSVVERFNRTIQEECIRRSDELYYDIPAFKEELTKYLYWYNYKRPHASLKYQAPMTFIQTHIPECG